MGGGAGGDLQGQMEWPSFEEGMTYTMVPPNWTLGHAQGADIVEAGTKAKTLYEVSEEQECTNAERAIADTGMISLFGTTQG